MNKQETITRLCSLASQVGEEIFDNVYPHDCFCQYSTNELEPKYFKMSDDVIEYIEQAVIRAMKQTKARAKKAQRKD